MAYYNIHTVMSVMRARKCGTQEAIAWLNHKPSDGPFIYQAKETADDLQ